MSYNYDLNPWDDTPAGQSTAPVSSSQANQYQPTQGYSASGGQDAYAPSGYSNPTAQYAAQDAWNQDQYDASSYNQQQQGDEETMNQQQQQQYQQDPNDRQQPPPAGFVSRFLRARVPLCGTCMDLTTPILDTLLKYVNRDLLASKIFYFFFYSAFGSLFPLMGVYFKQLGMNPSQVGILTGVRPFIEIFSAPFWNSLAERFQKSRMILLFSLISWIVFTYSLAHIRPPASACVAFNDTDYVLYTPYSANDLSNYDVGGLESLGPETSGANSETNESGGGGKRENNEVFMSKMPPGSSAKDEILVSEENVNDQGRRRRRRRRKRSYTPSSGVYQSFRPVEQIPRPARYLSEASPQLVLDLASDFEDTLLAGSGPEEPLGNRRAKRSPWKTSWGREPGDGDEQGESEGSESEGTGEESERPTKMTMNNSPESSMEGDEGNEEQQAEEDNEIVKQKEEHGAGAAAKHHQAATDESSDRGEESKSEAPQTTAQQEGGGVGGNKTKRIYKQRHKTPPTHIVGMSPITVEYAVNYNKEKHGQFVTPMFSTIVYKLEDIKEVFFLLLLLISLGEFFSAPAITIADSTTLSCLGANTDLYGRQRMFGSIGWAITLMLVGMALDNSKTIADHPCGPHVRERSYHVCFTIFSLLMGCALVTATQFKFNYPTKTSAPGGNQKLVTKTADDDGTVVTTTVDASQSANIDDVYASTRPREIFNTAPPVNAPPPGGSGQQQKFEFIDKWKSAVFAQSTWEPPEWLGVFRQFGNPMHLTYLFITWFLGCGVGLVFTFLFWHLQDVGGTPTLFGICSVINHISEILAYFFSSYFIKRYGHTKVLSVGLGCNVIRFLYVAFLSNPYYALPFELVQGITHAACFAACCSYMSHVSKPELKASTQGVMQGLHNGIGRACGALLGGYMINAIGSRASFCIYGLLSGCVLGGFLYARKRASDDGDVKVIDDGNLGNIGAPQGVPEKVRF